MTPEDAAGIIQRLLAGYPLVNLDEPSLETWIEAIEESRAEPAKALEVARRWPRTRERFPSLAEFLVAINPRDYNQPPDDPDDLRLNPVASQQMARVWRTELDKVAKRVAEIGAGKGSGGHWHGGPDPCPLCGGISHTAARRA